MAEGMGRAGSKAYGVSVLGMLGIIKGSRVWVGLDGGQRGQKYNLLVS